MHVSLTFYFYNIFRGSIFILMRSITILVTAVQKIHSYRQEGGFLVTFDSIILFLNRIGYDIVCWRIRKA